MKNNNKEQKNKEILKKVAKNIVLSIILVSLISANLEMIRQSKPKKSEDNTGFKLQVCIKDDNSMTFDDYMDLLEAYSNSKAIIEESDNTNYKNIETSQDTEIDSYENSIIEDEKTILEEVGITNSSLDSMSDKYDEELVIQVNRNYVKYVLDLIYDVNNDGISKEHKLNTICQLYNCSYRDLYYLYELFIQSIDNNPTINPYENVKNICNYITNKELLNNLAKNLNLENVGQNSDNLINNYLNNLEGNSFNVLVNTLYYKQINNTPLDTKLDYIYKRWGLNKDQLTVLIKCVICEAARFSYIDAYAVTTTIMNRMSSYKWMSGYNNMYEQLTKRFGVYYRGDYKCYDDLDLDALLEKYVGAVAVVECLYSELPIHNATNFWSNGYENENRVKFTTKGNNYFNENNQLSPEDRIPAEELQQVIFDKQIILLFPENAKVYPNLFDSYFMIDYSETNDNSKEDTLTRLK